MNCVDFDKHFESYVRQWSKENMARYKNVDAMEADIPEVYMPLAQRAVRLAQRPHAGQLLCAV